MSSSSQYERDSLTLLGQILDRLETNNQTIANLLSVLYEIKRQQQQTNDILREVRNLMLATDDYNDDDADHT